ncbi:MAG: hypothetical protein GX646_04080 [Bacteroidales bacterium]|jgi:hypothetical protein|nr:hypothetical protein [Bacteroidales bacterium]NLD63050.1 hypothetical protein [Bacteroidales bacterium]
MKKKNCTRIKAPRRRHILPCAFALLLIISMSQGADAQSFWDSQYNKRIFSVNSGAVFSGDGDCWGVGTSLSHLKTIGKRFYVRQNLTSWLINGESWIEGAFENQTAIDLSAELGFSPFRMGQRFFSIHGGFCGAYFINTDATGGGTWLSYNQITGEYSYMQYYEQVLRKAPDLGYTFGVNYHRQVSPALYLNARADFRSHFNTASAISMITVGIGFDARELFKK